jgi:hypothetical protein
MPPQLAALRRDPRIVGSTAAILCLLVDDLPGQPYGTFRDPVAAVMLSIIFGDSLALAVHRRWDRIGQRFFGVALLFKLFGQSFFYIKWSDAEVLDGAFLLLAHVVIGIAAFGGLRPRDTTLRDRAGILEVNAALAVLRCFAGFLAVAVALALLIPLYACAERYHSTKIEFYTLAGARALIPYLFWTTMVAFSWSLNKSRYKARPTKGQ